MTATPLLGISGSLRRQSYCTAVLRTLADAVAPQLALSLFPLAGVPLYNEDEDGARSPLEVTRLRDAIRGAMGLVVISPEYNHGMSGVLKNALDWASRPSSGSPLAGKPTLVMTAATSALGGVRAQAQLRETFAAAHARVTAGRQVVIGNVASKLTDGRLTDQATIGFALNAIGELVHEIGLLRSGRPLP
jgi:chromate reductase